MAEVTPLHPCQRCGRSARRRELVHEGRTLFEFLSCDACIEQTESELARVKPVFEAMLAAGVNRAVANYAMTCMLEHPQVFKPDEAEG